jgi:hypothetical protein
LLFHSNKGCTNIPQCYVTRTRYIACLVLLLFTAIIFTQCTTSYTLTARSLFSVLYDYPCTRMLYLLEYRWEPNEIRPLDFNTVLPSMLHVSCTYIHRALFHTFRLYEEHPPISKHESLYAGSSAKITSLCYIFSLNRTQHSIAGAGLHSGRREVRLDAAELMHVTGRFSLKVLMEINRRSDSKTKQIQFYTISPQGIYCFRSLNHLYHFPVAFRSIKYLRYLLITST